MATVANDAVRCGMAVAEFLGAEENLAAVGIFTDAVGGIFRGSRQQAGDPAGAARAVGAVWLSREEMPESDASISMTAKMMEAFRLGEDV